MLPPFGQVTRSPACWTSKWGHECTGTLPRRRSEGPRCDSLRVIVVFCMYKACSVFLTFILVNFGWMVTTSYIFYLHSWTHCCKHVYNRRLPVLLQEVGFKKILFKDEKTSGFFKDKNENRLHSLNLIHLKWQNNVNVKWHKRYKFYD